MLALNIEWKLLAVFYNVDQNYPFQFKLQFSTQFSAPLENYCIKRILIWECASLMRRQWSPEMIRWWIPYYERADSFAPFIGAGESIIADRVGREFVDNVRKFQPIRDALRIDNIDLTIQLMSIESFTRLLRCNTLVSRLVPHLKHVYANKPRCKIWLDCVINCVGEWIFRWFLRMRVKIHVSWTNRKTGNRKPGIV